MIRVLLFVLFLPVVLAGFLYALVAVHFAAGRQLAARAYRRFCE